VAKGVPIHKLTQPDGSLKDSAPVILVRLQEMYDWAPAMRDPQNVEDLHNMRIAAKRLRYTMEVFTPCFGPEFARALKTVEEIRSASGQIHDCDVRLPLLEKTSEREAERERKKALKKSGGGPPLFVAAEGLAPLIARTRTSASGCSMSSSRFGTVWTRMGFLRTFGNSFSSPVPLLRAKLWVRRPPPDLPAPVTADGSSSGTNGTADSTAAAAFQEPHPPANDPAPDAVAADSAGPVARDTALDATLPPAP
jgi:hypothetical protein